MELRPRRESAGALVSGDFVATWDFPGPDFGTWEATTQWNEFMRVGI